MSGWFEEQIKTRQRMDDACFEDAFARMGGAVMGVRLSETMDDVRQSAQDAVDELLRYCRVSTRMEYGGETAKASPEELLAPYGILSRSVLLNDTWWKDGTGAMLGRMRDSGSIVALLPRPCGGYVFRDPSTGRRVRVTKAVAAQIEEQASVFYRPFPMRPMRAGDLFLYLWRDIPTEDVLLYLLFALAVVLAGLVVPRVSKDVIALVVPAGNTTALAAAVVFMIFATVSSLLFALLRTVFYDRIGTRMSLDAEAAGVMRVLSLPVSVFRDYSAGDMAMRISYLKTLVQLVLSIGLSAGITALFSLIYVVQIAYFTPALAPAALVVVALQFAVVVASVLVEIPVSREWMRLEAKESGLAYELITSVRKIRISGAEKRSFSMWGRLFAKKSHFLYDPPVLLKVSNAVVSAISLAGWIAIYHIAIHRNIEVAAFYAFFAAFGMLEASLVAFSNIAGNIGWIRPILEMTKPILSAEPEEMKHSRRVESLQGAIELSHVSFRYRRDTPMVLSDINLKISPGQYVALVGKTGCGKSTLLRLLLGFEVPERGTVSYDNRDIRGVNLRSLRKRIGSVMQDGRLMAGSIFDNIRLNYPQLTMDEAWEAARMAGLAEDIKRMPMKMFTVVGESGRGVSGGQRQRILIARAIAAKPKVLLFDEATSALDNKNQKQVADVLRTIDATKVVIAHRLSTIRHCDRILVLDEGRIAEDGSYEALMEANGLFAQLVRQQQLEG